MLINEVEHIVGISKKSIRYYEENGLLTPKRNQENDYRIYSEKEIEKLKLIKFLRELNVSIRELKQLESGNLTLQECMEERIRQIEREEKNYQKIKSMCASISASVDTYKTIEIEEYFKTMNVLNKEGFTMRDIKTNKTKKIIGAIISSFLFGIFFLFLIGMVTYFQWAEPKSMPWLIYAFIVLILGIPLLGIIINLISRIKEINGGEEICEALGIVKGQIVQSKNIGRDFMAGMKTIVGGEIAGYTEMIATARQMATKRMVDDAKSLGADAIINVRYGSSAVMNGAAEIIAYGTAVKLKKETEFSFFCYENMVK